MNTIPFRSSPRSLLGISALATAMLLAAPAASAAPFYDEINYSNPPSDALVMDAVVSWYARTYQLTPLAWGQGTDLAGNVTFTPAGLQADLAGPAGSSDGAVGIAFEGNAGVATVLPTARYVERSNSLFGEDRTLIVRSWPVGNHTHVGVWSLNKATGRWVHHVTFNSPAPAASLGGNTKSIKEGTIPFGLPRPDSMVLGNGWNRLASASWSMLRAVDGAWYTGPIQHGQGSGGIENDANDLESWVVSPPSINSVLATTDGQSTWVSWRTSDVDGPQFSYRVDLLEDGMILGRLEGIGPHLRRVKFDDVRPSQHPGHRTARVSIVSIIDQASLISNATTSAVVTRTARREPVRLQTASNGWLETMPLPSTDGSLLQVTSAADRPRQSWDLMRLDAAGWFELRSIASGRCAQVEAGSRLAEHDCIGIDAQAFYLPAVTADAPSMLASKSLAPAAFALLQTGPDGQVTAASTSAFIAAIADRNACVSPYANAGAPDAVITACGDSASAWRVTPDGQD